MAEEQLRPGDARARRPALPDRSVADPPGHLVRRGAAAAGRAARTAVPRKRLYSPTTYIFVLWMVGSSLVLLAVATVFLRNQVKSLRRLAAAADSFGKGRAVAPFKIEGAARSSPGGGRVHDDARPHPAPDPPTHRDAGRRLARSAHAADADEARARAARQRPGCRRAQSRRRRDGAHGPRLSRFRSRRRAPRRRSKPTSRSCSRTSPHRCGATGRRCRWRARPSI